MSKITSHVLDVSIGRPAANLSVRLEAGSGAGEWSETARGVTDADGRVKDLSAGKNLPEGVYRLTFDTAAYFASRKVATLYPQVLIVFEVTNPQEHYHIPLLLSPFGYATYRGS